MSCRQTTHLSYSLLLLLLSERNPDLYYVIKKNDWRTFNDYIHQHLNIHHRLKAPEELEHAVNHFTTIIKRAGWNAIPQITTQRLDSYNVPLEIRQVVKEKGKTRAIWLRTHNTNDKKRYNRLTNKLGRGLRDTRNETFQAYVSSLSADDYSIWKAPKGFKKPQLQITPIRDRTGLWARSDHEKAQLFGV